MNTFNTKSIFSGLQILAVLAFGVISFSAVASANEGGNNYVYNTYTPPITVNQTNPKPSITTISPSSSNIGVGTKTITITGEGFVPSSIARINGSNRSTTFIDNSHLLIQITGNDTFAYRTNGGFFITVFNSGPGGGYSNTAFFTINNPVVSSTGGTTTNNTNNTSSNFTDTTIQTQNGNDDNNNLASNALFGSNSFMPSGIIQWIFFAILVLLIVILVRKIYGADRRYHATPLKHD